MIINIPYNGNEMAELNLRRPKRQNTFYICGLHCTIHRDKYGTVLVHTIPYKFNLRISHKFLVIGNPDGDIQPYVLHGGIVITDVKFTMKVAICNRKCNLRSRT